MIRLKRVVLCVRMNMKKAMADPKIYIVLAVSLIFQYYTFESIPAVCEMLGGRIAPWVFPFFLGFPSLFIIYGGMAVLLNCNVPLLDGQAPFVIIRMGRRGWILGQILSLCVSSLLYTLWSCLVPVLLLFPYISLETGWGKMIRTMAQQPDIFTKAGILPSFGVQKEIVDCLSPLQAMLLAAGLYWLGTVLIGMIILCFRVLTGRMVGIAISGVLISLSYFVCYLGALVYGTGLLYFSPLNWSCLSYLDLTGAGGMPSAGFAVVVDLVLIGILGVVSVVCFCKKDVMFAEEIK